MALTRTIPALPVADLVAARDFYTSRLGFEVLHADDGVVVLRRDEAVLNLWPADHEDWLARSDLSAKPVRSGAESFLAGTASCRIEVSSAAEVDDLHAELAATGVIHPTDTGAPAETEYGTLEFHVLDLDGNLISFHFWLPGR
ncbi:catechol 2,3-dioxygenase-like lactoylglutathione lyase family enzyme [Marmoricola sp. OAE513]|uniref:VOC family protein n=1 Tax=Marmoricola sp. OAE513 TaxID=2817894 RepID=UPI001AEAF632